MQETWDLSLGREDPLEKENPLEKGIAILAWRIPWTEEPGGPQSMGSQRLDTTKQLTHTHTHTHIGAWSESRMPLFYHHIKKKKISIFQRLYYLERSMESWKRRFFISVCMNIIPNKIFNVEIFEPSFIRHYIPCLECMAQCSVYQPPCGWVHLGLHGLSRSLRRPTLASA